MYLDSSNKEFDMRALTQSDFVTRSRSVHGDKYDYSKSTYVGASTKVTIKCRSCNLIFTQSASNHMYGSGCPHCAKLGGKGGRSYKKTTEQFILDARTVHGTRYDYRKVTYKGVRHKIKITCKKHGTFNQNPSSHLSGVGCPNCGLDVIGNLKRTNLNDFIDKALKVHGSTYSYKGVQLTHGLQDVISVSCPQHGNFKVTAMAHTRGQGCPACSSYNGHSNVAIRWLEYEAKKRRLNIQHARNEGEFVIPGTKLRVDGYNARTKTVFEFHGDAYHGNPNRHKPRSRPHPFDKTVTAKRLYLDTLAREQRLRDLGYTVVVMWESDWRAKVS